MADLEKALATQLANLEKRTGKSLAKLGKLGSDQEAPKKTYFSYRR